MIRNIDNTGVKRSDLENLIKRKAGKEILFSPTRVLMQDYTGVPAIADLAAMRNALKSKGIEPKKNKSTIKSRFNYRPFCYG